MTVTKIEGGTAVYWGQEVPVRETWIFDDGKQGTAVINIRVEPCSEEQRKKNRERLDDAVRLMARSQMLSV